MLHEWLQTANDNQKTLTQIQATTSLQERISLIVETFGLSYSDQDAIQTLLDELDALEPDVLLPRLETLQLDPSPNEDVPLEQVSFIYEDLVKEDVAFTPQEMLRHIFSDISFEDIARKLELCNYDIERTLEMLVNPTKPVSPPKQVCRHFLAGGCYRKDCWFSHDARAKVCKYWVQGSCLKGPGCEFAHEFDYSRLETNPVSTSHQSIPKQEDFPAMTFSSPKINFGTRSGFSAALKKKPVPQPIAYKPSNELLPPQAPRKKFQIKWVKTGVDAESQYMHFRKEAAELAVQRNKLFQKATEAYLSGNKAAAKQFSIDAHHLNEKMMTLQQEAAENIFQERNQTSYQSNEYTIDLHGLHPEEAIHFMEREVQDLKRKKWSGSVFIITGTGNHSRGGKAKVLPEIRQYLQSSRLKYREGTMSDGRGGVFYVTL